MAEETEAPEDIVARLNALAAAPPPKPNRISARPPIKLGDPRAAAERLFDVVAKYGWQLPLRAETSPGAMTLYHDDFPILTLREKRGGIELESRHGSSTRVKPTRLSYHPGAKDLVVGEGFNETPVGYVLQLISDELTVWHTHR